MSFLHSDPRRGIYTLKIIDTIITLLDGKGSTEDWRRRMQKSRKLSAIISSLVENHFIDLAWQGAINPSNFKELDTLRKSIKVMLASIDRLPMELTIALNYNPLSAKLSDVGERLITSTKDKIISLEKRAEALSQGASGRGRPEKHELKRTCDDARKLWETIEKRKFPMSFRTHNGCAVDSSFEFVYRVVCIFEPDTKLAEVSHQLQKPEPEEKKRKR